MKAIKAVYNFIVGDMVILIGIVLVFLVLILINNVAAFTPILRRRPRGGSPQRRTCEKGM